MCKNKDEYSEFYSTYKKIRKDWGEINPATRTIPDKKKDILENRNIKIIT